MESEQYLARIAAEERHREYWEAMLPRLTPFPVKYVQISTPTFRESHVVDIDWHPESTPESRTREIWQNAPVVE